MDENIQILILRILIMDETLRILDACFDDIILENEKVAICSEACCLFHKGQAFNATEYRSYSPCKFQMIIDHWQ